MNSVGHLSVQWLSELEMPLAEKFYRTYKFRGKPRRHDPCAVIRDDNHHIIACGYLRQLPGCQLLSGVAVSPEYQNQGVARQLLRVMTGSFNAQTYTFPYQHLSAFYHSLGFIEVPASDAKEPIAKLFYSYQQQGRSILLMAYQNDGLR